MSGIKPKQRVTKAEKTEEWYVSNGTYYKDIATTRRIDREEYLRKYRIANGYLDESEYTYVTNPLNTDNPKYKHYPAKLKNVDIISPVLLLLMGEKANRVINRIVISKKSDFESELAKKEHEMIVQSLQQIFVNKLAESGTIDEAMQQVPESPEVIKKKLSTLVDEKVVMGQRALEYINAYCEMERKFRKMFYDWLVVARAFSYKDVDNDEVVYNDCQPDAIEYLISETNEFIEDAECVKYTQKYSINEVFEMFKDSVGFNEEIMNDLESRIAYNTNAGRRVSMSQTEVFYDRMFGERHFDDDYVGIDVTHCVWRGFKLRKKVTGIDIFGNPYTKEMSEDYIALDTEEVEEVWVTSAHEVYIIDDKYYVGYGEIPYLCASMNNPNKLKLPYNGRVMSMRHVNPQSVVDRAEIYQKKYNIIYYFLEKVIAKNKDKMTILPLSLIPEKEGWDEETVMYYGDAQGYIFTDDADKNNLQALQYVKVLDMSLNAYIQQLYNILRNIKFDFEETVGITRQRKGDINSSDGLGTTQQAIYRGAVSTEEIFKQFDELQERDYQGVMNISQYAFSKGKKASFLSSDYKRMMLTIDPEIYCNEDYGVFCKDSGREKEKLDMVKSQATAFAQNQAKPSAVASIINCDNMTEVVQILSAMEQAFEEQQQANAQADRDSAEKIEQMRLADKEAERELTKYKIDEDNKSKRLTNTATVITDDGVNPADLEKARTERDALLIDSQDKAEKNQLKRDELELKERDSQRQYEVGMKDKSSKN